MSKTHYIPGSSHRKPLFERGSSSGFRACIFLLLAITLLICDHKFSYLHKLRSALSVLIVPIQKMVDMPVSLFGRVGTNFQTQQAVLDENAKLRFQQLRLQAKLQKLLALERENQQLRKLLASSSHISAKMQIAQLLAVGGSPLLQEVILNKGSQAGVFVGQTILDAHGVMGQVISVKPTTSAIMLISDIRSAIPVESNRSGARAIVAGTGYPDQLNLLSVVATSDIAVGDNLVTSGLGGRFPLGYPVGKVISVKKQAGERFLTVKVHPTAHLDSSRQVILLFTSQHNKQPTKW